MEHLDPLLRIARDLTASLASEDRYQRLVEAVRAFIPCDAACLLRLEGDELVPVAAHGLCPEALGMRFRRAEHPRLDAILRARGPLLFPIDSGLPDPFDGLLEGDRHALDAVHACLGCPLIAAGEVVGALTADALKPHVFDHLDPRLLATIGALAGAVMRTADLIERLESNARQQERIAHALQEEVGLHPEERLLGGSPAMRALRQEIETVAASDLTVLITGETGTGKELVSRAVHALSPRAGRPLIRVNCAALPEAMAESELFGHVRGAFTGAAGERAGKFEIADGGSLLLDEIGELPLAVQAKLLRVLQEGEVQRPGSDRPHRVDVRVIAATNRDLTREVARGRFRADLFHRLAVFPLHVPAVRDRREDVPLLAAHFLERRRRHLGLGPLRLREDAHAALQNAPWPGIVRELENVLSRAVLRAAARQRASGGEPGAPLQIERGDLDLNDSEPQAARPEPVRPSNPQLPLAARVDAFKRSELRTALEQSSGNWAAAARSLGLHRSNLHHLARRLGLKA